MRIFFFILITLGCLGIAVAHMVWPEVAIDGITLSFVILAIVPWILPWIKALELPGGAKIEFKDVEKAVEKVLSQDAALPVVKAKEEEALEVAEPGLVMVALRIEIEKRLRKLAETNQLEKPKGPLSVLVRDLVKKDVLKQSEVGGLFDLIGLGNRAAHGETVTSEAAAWAQKVGPQVLAVLDSKV